MINKKGNEKDMKRRNNYPRINVYDEKIKDYLIVPKY